VNFRKTLLIGLGLAVASVTLPFAVMKSITWLTPDDHTRTVRFRFVGPETYGNNQPYKGGGIYVNAWSPNTNMPCGAICSPSVDRDPSPTALACTVKLPKDAMLVGQVAMPVGERMIYFGDMSYNDFGGNGRLLGGLGVCANGTPIPVMLTPAPSWSDPDPNKTGEPGEWRTYNFKIQL
jgi:hypothetical protein